MRYNGWEGKFVNWKKTGDKKQRLKLVYFVLAADVNLQNYVKYYHTSSIGKKTIDPS